jgi:NTE family protein
MAKLFVKPKVGLALSGGAARGLAHIGVIKVIQEEHIPVDCVAGASVGSLMGALFAAGMRWRDMAETARRIRWKDLAQITLSQLGIAKHTKLKEIIDRLIGGKRFEDLPLPFAAVAVDLRTGCQVVLSSGPVADAVRASSSIPGLFEPTVLDGRALVDGGLLNNLPADVARGLGADVVLAVDLNAHHEEAPPPKNVLDILYRCFQIVLDHNERDERAQADIIIAPDLRGRSYYDLKPLDEMIDLGERAARAALPLIRKICKMKYLNEK